MTTTTWSANQPPHRWAASASPPSTRWWRSSGQARANAAAASAAAAAAAALAAKKAQPPEPPPADTPEVTALIAEFNELYFVVNENGRATIYAPKHDPDQNRRFYERIEFIDLDKMYLNRTVLCSSPPPRSLRTASLAGFFDLSHTPGPFTGSRVETEPKIGCHRAGQESTASQLRKTPTRPRQCASPSPAAGLAGGRHPGAALPKAPTAVRARRRTQTPPEPVGAVHAPPTPGRGAGHGRHSP